MHRWIEDNCTRERIAQGLALVVLIGGVMAASVIAAKGQAKNTGREAAQAGTDAAQRVAATQLAKGCGRTQVQRGYLILRAQENLKHENGVSSHAPELFRLVWCERTYAAGYKGDPVYLPAASARCFLTLLRLGYWDDRQPFTDPTRLRRACTLS